MWFLLVLVAAMVLSINAIPCEEARMKCAYRVGCGRALQNYMVECSSVLQEPPPSSCPGRCQDALTALTSTNEGQDLMNCACTDDFCKDQKMKAEICKPQVLAQMNLSVVTCRVAQWICTADSTCSAALDYYHRNCKSMFHGRKCTPRCHNSINILKRQEAAQKLDTCECDGSEQYDCKAIRKNMEKLCFHPKRPPTHGHPVTTEPPPTTTPSGCSNTSKLTFTAIMLVVLIIIT